VERCSHDLVNGKKSSEWGEELLKKRGDGRGCPGGPGQFGVACSHGRGDQFCAGLGREFL